MKLLKRIGRHISHFFRSTSVRDSPSKEVLVYVGMNRGEGFDGIFHDYERCFGFEPNPVLYDHLMEKYKKFSWVNIVNAAAAIDDTEDLSLYVTDNDGASSSVYPLKEAWHKSREVRKAPTIGLQGKITVRGINLPRYLDDHGISEITDYVSDIEGMDLAVLKTMNRYILDKKIQAITCEVSKDELRNRHVGCPDNSLGGFTELLSGNYELVAVGYMPLLTDGVFGEIPEESWAMDCRWKLKQN